MEVLIRSLIPRQREGAITRIVESQQNWEGKNAEKQKPRAHDVLCARGQILTTGVSGLEVNFGAELQDSRVEGGSNQTEVAVGEGVINVVELRMGPSVEGFHTQFKAATARLA